jgi:fatty acid desaturase
MFIGYCWYLSLPFGVFLGSLLIGGFLVAIVVTCNHQTEDILPTNSQYCFFTDQFQTTRGVRCDDPITEYLFGGMQYQLEHHLFPTMPRYYFPKLRPVIKEFALKHGLPHKVSGVFEIMKLNYDVLRKHSGAAQKNEFIAKSANGPKSPFTAHKAKTN